jgi:MoaA/NifB/PqqE/SkfB family radical SAM enzyme
MKCIYCYGIKQKPSPAYIPLDRLKLLVDDAVACEVRSLAIIGDGEPTMNKGLYEFVEHGRSKGLDMSVATNGLLLNEEKVRRLTSSLVWLRFNISGVEKYDKIHTTYNGLHKFEKVIRWAVKHKGGCTVGLQMVLIPECFSEVIPLTKKAIEWGVDYLVIKQFSDPGEAIPSRFDMDEYDKVMDELSTAQEMSTDETKIVVKWSAIHDTREITQHKRWGFDRCIDLPFIFQISGDGGCYPCGYLFGSVDHCYGNVVHDRLRDILTSDRYWEVIGRVKKTMLETLCKGQCRHCETNRFMDRLTKEYVTEKNLEKALINMCGSESIYKDVLTHPPKHINFV